MQSTVNSAGEADSFALLLLLAHSEHKTRVVRYFVCSECLDVIEVAEGWGHMHGCGEDAAELRSKQIHEGGSII